MGCCTDAAAAIELTQPFQPRKVEDICNRFRRVSAELGAVAHWHEEDQRSESAGHPLVQLSMAARKDISTLELSNNEDSQSLGRRIDRALRILATRKIHTAEQLMLPNGRWLPFFALPEELKKLSWNATDYLALCQAVDSTLTDVDQHDIGAGSITQQHTLDDSDS